ncbi:hypothetical protein PG988_001538 [Apiospora saccharicola]
MSHQPTLHSLSCQGKRKAGDNVADSHPCDKKIKIETSLHHQRLTDPSNLCNANSPSSAKRPETTPIPELPGDLVMQIVLKILYHGLNITPRQVRWIDLSEARTPRQALADILKVALYLSEDVSTMVREILATPSNGYPSACFIKALGATYQDEELRSIGLGFDGRDLPRKWKTAAGKDRTDLTLRLYRWLLDLSHYTFTAIHIVAALLRLPAFQGEPSLDAPTKLALYLEHWRAYLGLDYAVEKVRKEAGTKISKRWTRWFRAPRLPLTKGAPGEAISAYMPGVDDCVEAIIVHNWRPVDVWKLDQCRFESRNWRTQPRRDDASPTDHPRPLDRGFLRIRVRGGSTHVIPLSGRLQEALSRMKSGSGPAPSRGVLPASPRHGLHTVVS